MSERSAWQRAAMVLLVAVGVSLRLRAYLSNRSLWLDEALLTLNILDRDYARLLQTLDKGQAAPVGFLFAERLMVDLFGSSEYTLRAIPLIASIASVVAFGWLASKILPPAGAIMAVAMFAISDLLLNYAVEVKQYSSDVAVAVGLWSLFTVLRRRLDEDDWRAWLLVAVLGTVAIWMSHPAIFVVGGAAAYWLWQAVRTASRKSLMMRGGVAAVLVASFAALYFVSLRSISPSLYRSWRGAEVPIVPLSWREVNQYYNFVWTLGVLPLGHQVAQIVIVCAIVGVIAMWQSRSPHGVWFAGALILAAVASSLGKFPVGVRLWLFFGPVMIVLVAAGLNAIWTRTRHVFPALAPLMAGLVLVYPAVSAVRGAVAPRQHEEIRPLLRHIETHRQEGDVLYIYREAQYAVRYYAARGFRFPGETFVGPIGDRYQAERDVDRLRGRKRVWIVFSHVVVSPHGFAEDALLIYLLDRVGTQLQAAGRKGAALYLYDMSMPP